MNIRAEAFGKLSKEKVIQNSEYIRQLKLPGERIEVPSRGGKLQTILHRSSIEGPVPTIFEIYGGCFSQGNVANNTRLRVKMQEATHFNIIGLDYRKSPEFPYPCAVEDIYDAILYFYTKHQQYHIDRDRMAVWGHSAGGNLACVVALKAKQTGAFSLKAQLLDYPYLDAYTPGIKKTSSTTGLTAEVLDAMNEIYATEEQRKELFVSPVLASTEDLKDLPATAIAICGIDPLKHEALSMVSKLVIAGVPVLAKLFPQASHGFLEHWFFREYYLESLSKEERAGIPENLESIAEEGLRFIISAASYLLND